MSSSPVKVLYIAGWTRSGSTLFDNLLGELEGFFSAGELIALWRRGLEQGRRCGCGQRLSDCEVWSRVLWEAVGPVEGRATKASRLLELRDRVVRLRNLPRLLRVAGTGSHRPWADLDEYAAALGRVYRSLAATTGASVIVNSSKLPHEAAAELSVEGIDLYLVHLVRDPRAVAFSMKRQSMLQPDPSDPVPMPRAGPLASSSGWLRANAATEALSRHLQPRRSVLVRYETLATQPEVVLSDVARLLGGSPPDAEMFAGNEVVLHGNHTVWGNSFRFKKGPVLVRLDEEWKRAMPLRDRALATVPAMPLLHRYDYPVRASV